MAIKAWLFLASSITSIAHIFIISRKDSHIRTLSGFAQNSRYETEKSANHFSVMGSIILPTHRSFMAVTCVRVSSAADVGVPSCHSGTSKDEWKCNTSSVTLVMAAPYLVNEYHLRFRIVCAVYTLQCLHFRLESGILVAVFERAEAKLWARAVMMTRTSQSPHQANGYKNTWDN